MTVSRRQRGRSRIRDPLFAFIDYVPVVIGLVALLFLLPHGFGIDDVVRLSTIERLLPHGALVGNKHSTVMPLMSAPLLLIGEAVKSPTTDQRF